MYKNTIEIPVNKIKTNSINDDDVFIRPKTMRMKTK